MVLPLSHGVPRAPRYSGYRTPWTASHTGLSPVSPRLSMRCSARCLPVCSGPNPGRAVTPPVWARPSSIASTKGFTVVFSSSGYLDVSVHRVRPAMRGSAVARTGLPHSDIPGSKVICTSPELFAACHVFRRLLKPRHPPSALVHFLCNVFYCWSAHCCILCPCAHAHGLAMSRRRRFLQMCRCCSCVVY